MKNDERAAAVCRELKQGKMPIAELQKKTGYSLSSVIRVPGMIWQEG